MMPLSKNVAKIAVGVAASAACLWLMFSRLDLGQLGQSLEQADPAWVAAAAASVLVGYILRISRWRLLLAVYHRNIGWKNCAPPYLSSITLNNCLPLRAGDVVRAFVFPKSMGIPVSLSLNTLIIERAMDIAILGIFLLAGVYAISSDSPYAVPAILLLVAAIGVLGTALFSARHVRALLLLLVKKIPRLKRTVLFCNQMLRQLRDLLRPATLLAVFGLSIAVWLFESGLFYFVCLSLGERLSPLMVLFICSSATLSTLLPSTPGYIGTFHMAAFLAVKSAGAMDERAAAIAILSHAVLWITTTTPGLFTMAFISRSDKKQ